MKNINNFKERIEFVHGFYRHNNKIITVIGISLEEFEL